MKRHTISLAERVILPILVSVVAAFVVNLAHLNFIYSVVFGLAFLLVSGWISYALVESGTLVTAVTDQVIPDQSSSVEEPETQNFQQTETNDSELVPTNMTASYLCGLFEKYEHHEATKVVKRYLHKQMRFTGKVFDIRDGYDHGGWLYISSDGVRISGGVTASFDKQEFDDITILLKDKTITVQGELVEIDALDVALHHCKILKQPRTL